MKYEDYEAQARDIEKSFEFLLKEIHDTIWIRNEARGNYDDATRTLDRTAMKKSALQLEKCDAKLDELYERREQLHTEEKNIHIKISKEHHRQNLEAASRLSDDDLIEILKERGLI